MSRFDQAKDDYDHGDEESLLDLSILNASAPRTAPESVAASLDGRIAQHNQGRIEEHLDGQGEVVSESVIINLDVVNAHLNMQEDEEENADYSRQPPFLRMVRRTVVRFYKNNLYMNLGCGRALFQKSLSEETLMHAQFRLKNKVKKKLECYIHYPYQFCYMMRLLTCERRLRRVKWTASTNLYKFLSVLFASLPVPIQFIRCVTGLAAPGPAHVNIWPGKYMKHLQLTSIESRFNPSLDGLGDS